MERLLLAMCFLASPPSVKGEDCNTVGKNLATTARTCVDSSASKETCVQQALAKYSSAIRKIPGGCDDTSKELHACLKGCAGDEKIDAMKACLGAAEAGATPTPLLEGQVSQIPPPPPRPEDGSPKPGFVWMRGHWYPLEGAWEWADGRYLKERPGMMWLDGRWEMSAGEWHFVPGRWEALPK